MLPLPAQTATNIKDSLSCYVDMFHEGKRVSSADRLEIDFKSIFSADDCAHEERLSHQPYPNAQEYFWMKEKKGPKRPKQPSGK